MENSIESSAVFESTSKGDNQQIPLHQDITTLPFPTYPHILYIVHNVFLYKSKSMSKFIFTAQYRIHNTV